MPPYVTPATIHGSSNIDLIKRSIEKWIQTNILNALPDPPYPAGSVVWDVAGLPSTVLTKPSVKAALVTYLAQTSQEHARNSGDATFNKETWNKGTWSVIVKRKLQTDQLASINAVWGLDTYLINALQNANIPVIDWNDPGLPEVALVRFREVARGYEGTDPAEAGVEKLRLDIDFRWQGLYRTFQVIGSQIGQSNIGDPIGL